METQTCDNQLSPAWVFSAKFLTVKCLFDYVYFTEFCGLDLHKGSGYSHYQIWFNSFSSRNFVLLIALIRVKMFFSFKCIWKHLRSNISDIKLHSKKHFLVYILYFCFSIKPISFWKQVLSLITLSYHIFKNCITQYNWVLYINILSPLYFRKRVPQKGEGGFILYLGVLKNPWI